MALLTVRNLSVRFGGVAAVSRVNLSLADGEVVGLVGPNGAGKTSTVLAIAGAVAAVSKEVSFAQEDISELSPEQIVRRGISIVPETREIFSRMTVMENLQLGATPRPKGEILKTDLDRIFRLFPILRERARQPAGQLSGGEQQMLAIGRALMAKPRLLMLDEPSLGLAPAVTDFVYSAIRELQSDGLSLLIVEQNVRRALAACDRIYVFSAGTVRSEGPASSFLTEHQIDRAYFGSHAS